MLRSRIQKNQVCIGLLYTTYLPNRIEYLLRASHRDKALRIQKRVSNGLHSLSSADKWGRQTHKPLGFKERKASFPVAGMVGEVSL